MNNILYISLTGMTEPLGRSQVLEYLIDLSKNNNIYLISFERENDLEQIDEIKSLVEKNGITWKYFIYSNKYGVFSTIMQIFQSVQVGSKLIQENNIDIIHARSLIPATMGLVLKQLYGVKLLFDIRGFAIDEKIDSGRVAEGSLLYRVLKKLDDHLYKTADHIVTLTHTAKEILHERLDIPVGRITVIPTCANKEIFKTLTDEEKNHFKTSLGYDKDDKVILHTGTVSGWYDFEREVKLVKEMMHQDDKIHFLVLNKNEHDFIKEVFLRQGLPDERVRISSSSFEEVYKYLNMATASLFFIRPSYSKQASAPTKFAENVACYLPSITNTGVGDMEFYMTKYDVGYLVDMKQLDENLTDIASDIIEKLENKKVDKKVYDTLFEEHFDKKMAVERYLTIYTLLGTNI